MKRILSVTVAVLLAVALGACSGAKAPAEQAIKAAGAVTLNYGLFVNTVVNFLIVAFAIFFLIRGMNALKKKEEAPAAAPTTKECPHCLSTIPIKATRCGHCTSELRAA